jgi:hypothetical protein
VFAAIRVSKACYHDSIGMLWRESTQKRLVKASTPERRQHYANMIYCWDLDDKHSWKLFEGLNFPLLTDLSFWRDSLSAMQLRRYSQEGLHTLRQTHCELDTAMLETMATCYTQIQTLIILYPNTRGVTPGQFLTFLQSLPALRRLRLDYVENRIMNKVFEWEGSPIAQLEELSWTESWHSSTTFALRNKFLKHCTGLRELYLDLRDALSTDALIQLSSLPLLEFLHVDGWLADDQFQQRFIEENTGASPFPSIKDLRICGEASTIKALLSSLPKTLLSLDLRIDDNSNSILPTISRLSNLTNLKIMFNEHREFSRADLDYVSRLSRLQKCRLERRYWASTRENSYASKDYPWLTDRYLIGWISELPLLQDLCLNLDSVTITHSSLPVPR